MPDFSADSPNGANRAGGEPPLYKGRVLIVDDEQVVCDILREMLEDYEVSVALNVAAARRILAAEGAMLHLVLLDLNLPDASGQDFLEEIKSGYPELEVIIVSGSREERRLIECLAAGASDFLEKPFHVEKVMRSVNRVLRKSFRQKIEPSPESRVKVQTSTIRAVTPAEGWMELTAPSEFEYLGRLQRFTEILFVSRLSHEDCEDIRMAMEEIGRNAIEWGNRFDPGKQVRISYCFFKDRVVLKFEDEGEGFKPGALPDPSKNPGEHLKKRAENGKRPGGFGVFLVHNIMDEVVYSERGNIVLMTKLFNK